MAEKPIILEDLKGDEGIYRTVKFMIMLSKNDSDSKSVQEIADKIRSISKIPELMVIAAYDWVFDNIKYVRDEIHVLDHARKFKFRKNENVDDVEFLVSPRHNIEKYHQGDCDDMTMILSSLFLNLGIRVRIKVIATQSMEYSHVYAEALIPEINSWVPVDPVIKEFGIEYVPNRRSETFEVI